MKQTHKLKKLFTSYFTLAVLLAVVLCGLDLLSKQLAVSYLTLHEPVYMLPFLNFTLAFNKGVAFSFLSENENGFVIITSITFLVICYIFFLLYKEKNILLLEALSFILGGALGNFIDRVSYGMVVDFISVHWQSKYFFAIFNVADIFINIGVYLLIIDFFVSRKKNG